MLASSFTQNTHATDLRTKRSRHGPDFISNKPYLITTYTAINMTTPADQATPKILWSCVARNETILAEAGEDCYGGLVAETAKGLLSRKPTPGYEFHQSRRWNPVRQSSRSQPRLRGCKFHIYEHDTENVQNVMVWVFAAVYDIAAVELVEVQSFLEKIVTLTEMFREDEEWRNGETLSLQSTFAPILLQRMQEVTYLGKMAMLEQSLDESRKIMSDNVDLLLDREEVLREKLDKKSSAMTDMAQVFKKRTRKVRRMKMMQNAKHGLLMGTAVTAGVACIVVPPLVALL